MLVETYSSKVNNDPIISVISEKPGIDNHYTAVRCFLINILMAKYTLSEDSEYLLIIENEELELASTVGYSNCTNGTCIKRKTTYRFKFRFNYKHNSDPVIDIYGNVNTNDDFDIIDFTRSSIAENADDKTFFTNATNSNVVVKI